MNRFVVVTFVALCACSVGRSGSDCFDNTRVPVIQADAVVSWGNICIPEGKFLLFKGDGEIGAVVFRNVHEANHETMTGCAEYDVYYRRDGILTFRDGKFK